MPPLEAVLGRAKARDIDTVIVGGEALLKNGSHQRVNKDEITRELRDQLDRPLEPHTLETRRMVARLRPYAEEFYRSWESEGGAPRVGTPHYVFNSRT